MGTKMGNIYRIMQFLNQYPMKTPTIGCNQLQNTRFGLPIKQLRPMHSLFGKLSTRDMHLRRYPTHSSISSALLSLVNHSQLGSILRDYANPPATVLKNCTLLP